MKKNRQLTLQALLYLSTVAVLLAFASAAYAQDDWLEESLEQRRTTSTPAVRHTPELAESEAVAGIQEAYEQGGLSAVEDYVDNYESTDNADVLIHGLEENAATFAGAGLSISAVTLRELAVELYREYLPDRTGDALDAAEYLEDYYASQGDDNLETHWAGTVEWIRSRVPQRDSHTAPSMAGEEKPTGDGETSDSPDSAEDGTLQEEDMPALGYGSNEGVACDGNDSFEEAEELDFTIERDNLFNLIEDTGGPAIHIARDITCDMPGETDYFFFDLEPGTLRQFKIKDAGDDESICLEDSYLLLFRPFYVFDDDVMLLENYTNSTFRCSLVVVWSDEPDLPDSMHLMDTHVPLPPISICNTEISPGESVRGEISSLADGDLFRVDAPSYRPLHFSVDDPRMYLALYNGEKARQAEGRGTLTAELSDLRGSEFYVVVYGNKGEYTLSLE